MARASPILTSSAAAGQYTGCRLRIRAVASVYGLSPPCTGCRPVTRTGHEEPVTRTGHEDRSRGAGHEERADPHTRPWCWGECMFL